MAESTMGYVVTSYVLTWVVILGMLVRVLGAVRQARHEYEAVVKGDFNS